MKEVSIQYVRFTEIRSLTSEERVDKLLDIVKQEKIVFLEGQLRKTEEATLIAETMKHISQKFKGIELATILPEEEQTFVKKLTSRVAKLLIGHSDGLTIIGPASIVRQIKQDPKKLQLFSINLG